MNKLIKEAFRENNIDLENFLNQHKCITFISKQDTVDSFKDMGIHYKDAILLNEAYHLHLTLDQPVDFITFDSNVLKSKNEISKVARI